MKQIKQLSIWIIALAGWMIATDAVQAKDYDFKHDGLYYKITQAIPPRQVKVVSENAYQPYYSAGNEPTGAVTVPKSFSRKEGIFTYTYTVTEIGNRAFLWCTKITSVSIPDGITRIGDFAFYNCMALKSITIPGSVKTIGWKAFTYCETLKSVTLPNSIQEIEEMTFGHCYALQSIDIPASVKTIGKWAFSTCDALKSVTLPSGIQEIGEGAFRECDALKTVTVHWNTPLAVPENTFKDVSTANVTLKVPHGTKKKYQAAAVWKDFRIDEGKSPHHDFEHNGLFYIITKNTGPSSAEVRVVPEDRADALKGLSVYFCSR